MTGSFPNPCISEDDFLWGEVKFLSLHMAVSNKKKNTSTVILVDTYKSTQPFRKEKVFWDQCKHKGLKIWCNLHMQIRLASEVLTFL